MDFVDFVILVLFGVWLYAAGILVGEAALYIKEQREHSEKQQAIQQMKNIYSTNKKAA